MNLPYNLYAQRPAFAPYAQAYVPPQYPLVSLVGQGPATTTTTTTAPVPPVTAPNGAAQPTGIMATLQKTGPLNIPIWAWLLGSLGIGGVALAWSGGVFDGGRAPARAGGARRDFSFANDAGSGRRRTKRRSTTRRARGARAGGFGTGGFGGGRSRGRRDPALSLTGGRAGGARTRSGRNGRRDFSLFSF